MRRVAIGILCEWLGDGRVREGLVGGDEIVLWDA